MLRQLYVLCIRLRMRRKHFLSWIKHCLNIIITPCFEMLKRYGLRSCTLNNEKYQGIPIKNTHNNVVIMGYVSSKDGFFELDETPFLL